MHDILILLLSSAIPVVVYVATRKLLPSIYDTPTTGEGDSRQNQMSSIIFTFVMAVTISFFLLNYNNSEGQEGQFDTFTHGMFHGFGLSLFVATPVLGATMYRLGFKWKSILLEIVSWSISLVLMGGVMDKFVHW